MTAYVELHARSAFSFLRGASQPGALVAEAARLGLPGVALCDRDGVYGAPRLFGAAKEHGIRPIVGCELTLIDGTAVPLLVATREGYQNLCQLITTAKNTERPEGRLETTIERSPSSHAPTACPPGLSPSNGEVGHYPRDGTKPGSAPSTAQLRERKRPCFATWEEVAPHATGLI